MGQSLLFRKLLSHRLRGFDDIENTAKALYQACNSTVPYLEIDTRVSKDGEIYVFHDPFFQVNRTTRSRICDTPLREIDSWIYPAGERLLRLDKALEIFSNRRFKDQKLCLDLKDFGLECRHLEKVREADLEQSVYFVSWMPQSLVQLWEMGAKAPLILSHWNLYRYGLFGRFAAITLGKLRLGYKDVLICRELPKSLVRILKQSGGGICIHTSVVCEDLVSYCRKNGLKIWVFGARNFSQYVRYAKNPFINVVFCDDAATTKEALKKK